MTIQPPPPPPPSLQERLLQQFRLLKITPREEWLTRCEQRINLRSMGYCIDPLLPTRFRDDPKFFVDLVKRNRLAYTQIPTKFQHHKEVGLALVQTHGSINDFANLLPEKLRDDIDIVRHAVQISGLALRFVSSRLQSDHGIVLAAVQNTGIALQYASKALQADPVIVIAALCSTPLLHGGNGHVLRHASEEIQSDMHFIQIALSNGLMVGDLPQKLRCNREIVQLSVRRDGMQLKFGSEELRNDRAIVMDAVSSNGRSLQYASESLRADKEIVMVAVSAGTQGNCHGCVPLQYASDCLRADREVVMAAIFANPLSLEFASEKLKSDYELVLTAVSKDGMALGFAAKKLCGNYDIVYEAVTNAPHALEFACYDLQADRKIVMAALSRKHHYRNYALRFTRWNLKSDFDLVLAAVSLDGGNLQYANEHLRDNPQIVAAALKSGVFEEDSFNRSFRQQAVWCGASLLKKVKAVVSILSKEPIIGGSMDQLVALRVKNFKEYEILLPGILSRFPEDISGTIVSFLGDRTTDKWLCDCYPVLLAYNEQFAKKDKRWAILSNTQFILF